jgi:integrase
MTNEGAAMSDITIYQPGEGIQVYNDMQTVGKMADQAAAAAAFEDYQNTKAKNSDRRHAVDLAQFRAYLISKGTRVGDLHSDPEAWRDISYGLVKGFFVWLLANGYAIATANQRLSTVKVYAKLATQAGTLAADELVRIKTITGYKQGEGKRVDEKRVTDAIPTRRGHKKAACVSISKAQARALKTQPDTAQGRRDALMMALLLDHGLRCGELAVLQVTDFDLTAGMMTFYRPKVDKLQTHKLTPDTLRAARAYFDNDAPAAGPVMRGSRKGGKLEAAGMTVQSITERVRVLGEAAGLRGLSAHDCRHHGATQAARNGTSIDRLMSWGGWTSPAMPMRYVEAAKIANDGVNLGSD